MHRSPPRQRMERGCWPFQIPCDLSQLKPELCQPLLNSMLNSLRLLVKYTCSLGLKLPQLCCWETLLWEKSLYFSYLFQATNPSFFKSLAWFCLFPQQPPRGELSFLEQHPRDGDSGWGKQATASVVSVLHAANGQAWEGEWTGLGCVILWFFSSFIWTLDRILLCGVRHDSYLIIFSRWLSGFPRLHFLNSSSLPSIWGPLLSYTKFLYLGAH